MLSGFFLFNQTPHYTPTFGLFCNDGCTRNVKNMWLHIFAKNLQYAMESNQYLSFSTIYSTYFNVVGVFYLTKLSIFRLILQ